MTGDTAKQALEGINEAATDNAWAEIIKEDTVELDNHTAFYLTFEDGLAYFIEYEGVCTSA